MSAALGWSRAASPSADRFHGATTPSRAAAAASPSPRCGVGSRPLGKRDTNVVVVVGRRRGDGRGRARGPHPPRAAFPIFLPLSEWNYPGLASDAAVAVASYIVSDLIAQSSERKVAASSVDTRAPALVDPSPSAPALATWDARRLRRYATFGAMDGVFSHGWYTWLDDAVATWPGVATWPAGGVAGGIENANAAGLRVAESIVADMTIFAPMWCAAFLTTMAVLAAKDGHEEEEKEEEDGGRGDAPPTRRAENGLDETWWQSAPRAARKRLKEEWFTLYAADAAWWIPADVIVYGVAPVQFRVGTYAAINVVYTALLSLWAEKKLLKELALAKALSREEETSTS